MEKCVCCGEPKVGSDGICTYCGFDNITGQISEGLKDQPNVVTPNLHPEMFDSSNTNTDKLGGSNPYSNGEGGFNPYSQETESVSLHSDINTAPVHFKYVDSSLYEDMNLDNLKSTNNGSGSYKEVPFDNKPIEETEHIEKDEDGNEKLGKYNIAFAIMLLVMFLGSMINLKGHSIIKLVIFIVSAIAAITGFERFKKYRGIVLVVIVLELLLIMFVMYSDLYL